MLINDGKYLEIISDIKSQIKSAQYRAVLSANKELICLYWQIGKVINDNSVWGNKFIENLAKDIKLEFPSATGYSVRNLKYMAKFQGEYTDFEFVQTVSAQLPWSHNTTILDKVKDCQERIWYIQKCTQNGWSVNVLKHQIESQLYQRQMLSDKIQNFNEKLPALQSELAMQTMKDPYIFNFISVAEDANEKNHVVAEYALKDMSKAMGISEYQLTKVLPQNLEHTLPSTEDLVNRVKFKKIED